MKDEKEIRLEICEKLAKAIESNNKSVQKYYAMLAGANEEERMIFTSINIGFDAGYRTAIAYICNVLTLMTKDENQVIDMIERIEV